MPKKRLRTARHPPVYPNSSPDHRACNSLTPFHCPSRRPSVDSGLGWEFCENRHAACCYTSVMVVSLVLAFWPEPDNWYMWYEDAVHAGN